MARSPVLGRCSTNSGRMTGYRSKFHLDLRPSVLAASRWLSLWIQKTFSRILEPSPASRYSVPTPTPISAAIRFQPKPCVRSAAIIFVSKSLRGRPRRFVLAPTLYRDLDRGWRQMRRFSAWFILRQYQSSFAPKSRYVAKPVRSTSQGTFPISAAGAMPARVYYHQENGASYHGACKFMDLVACPAFPCVVAPHPKPAGVSRNIQSSTSSSAGGVSVIRLHSTYSNSATYLTQSLQRVTRPVCVS